MLGLTQIHLDSFHLNMMLMISNKLKMLWKFGLIVVQHTLTY